MITKRCIALLFITMALTGSAQMNIGSNTAPNADAMLEISGSSKGLLLPRVPLASTSSASPLSAHVAGMSVYNTATAGSGATAVTPGYYYNTGSAWVRVAAASGSSASWLTGGNLNGAVSNIGTNDNYDLPFVTNNNERMRIANTGDVGIGTSTPAAKLDVATGATTVNTAINATGSINDFLQFNVQNTSNGAHAQSGYSSTADNGSATTGFAWIGINNSNFNYPTTYNIGGGNDVSLLGSGQDLYVANANNTKSIIFSTGKSTTPFFNERMRITNAGNVGIGTSTPAANLDVAAGTTTVNTVINATGNINDYLQFNVQNTSTGTNAQSGYSSTADNGSATTGFAWVGINNSNFNYPTTYNIGGSNDVSLLGSGQDLYVANANNTKSIIFSTGKSTTPFFNERMRITNAGYVGIGTSAPAYPLDVQNTLSTSISNYGYLNGTGASGYISGSSGTTNFSARFSGRIICPEFNALSDARIKNIKGRSNSKSDLETLNAIRITDYEMKDTVQWGHKSFKKVIAQEVEQVYAQAVNRAAGFIPDVYQQAAGVEKTGANYTFTFCKPLSIGAQAGRIRIISADGNLDMDVVAMPDCYTLVLKGDHADLKAGEPVFVYGEEINDFRVVDYEALGTLNISATQELSRQVDLLKQENMLLKARLEQLYHENSSLKEETAGRIEKLEASFKSLSASVTGKIE